VRKALANKEKIKMRKWMKYSALFLWIVGIIEIVIIAWFILPGAYRYEAINVFGYAADIRINRFTGATEIYGPGWQEIAFDGKTVTFTKGASMIVGARMPFLGCSLFIKITILFIFAFWVVLMYQHIRKKNRVQAEVISNNIT
jgi:hypothetical protein